MTMCTIKEWYQIIDMFLITERGARQAPEITSERSAQNTQTRTNFENLPNWYKLGFIKRLGINVSKTSCIVVWERMMNGLYSPYMSIYHTIHKEIQ